MGTGSKVVFILAETNRTPLAHCGRHERNLAFYVTRLEDRAPLLIRETARLAFIRGHTVPDFQVLVCASTSYRSSRINSCCGKILSSTPPLTLHMSLTAYRLARSLFQITLGHGMRFRPKNLAASVVTRGPSLLVTTGIRPL